MVDRRHSEHSRLIRALWRRTGSFWSRLISVVVALCVLSIGISSSWTYTHHDKAKPLHSAAQLKAAREHATLTAPADTLHSQPIVVREPVIGHVPALVVDTAPEVSWSDTPVVQTISNTTSVLIGMLSDPAEDVEFRAVARATWVGTARASGQAEAVFFFTQEHASDPKLQQEAAQYGDVVFGGRDSSMPVAYQMLEHLSQLFTGAHQILRVDVRSYVAVKRLLSRLEEVCARPGCAGENIWAGSIVSYEDVAPGNQQYAEDTGLSMYLPHMSSAYILSTSLAQSLSLMNSDIGLKMYGGEELSLGVWLIPMAARRIDFGSAVHLESPCCFDSAGVMTFNICSRKSVQYPVIVSVLEKPEYVKQYHDALEACPDQNSLV